uniref:PAP-associated domain-containing protein n=1 Tax=Panagrellus redivivus TaxID=6233 RepID=A0A7E4VWS8_PANRE
MAAIGNGKRARAGNNDSRRVEMRAGNAARGLPHSPVSQLFAVRFEFNVVIMSSVVRELPPDPFFTEFVDGFLQTIQVPHYVPFDRLHEFEDKIDIEAFCASEDQRELRWVQKQAQKDAQSVETEPPALPSVPDLDEVNSAPPSKPIAAKPSRDSKKRRRQVKKATSTPAATDPVRVEVVTGDQVVMPPRIPASGIEQRPAQTTASAKSFFIDGSCGLDCLL